MRNFFKSRFGKTNSKEIPEILDTDEDRVIYQYKGYLNYLNSLKKELIRRSAELVGYKKRVTAS